MLQITMFFLGHNRAVPMEGPAIWGKRGLRKIEGLLKEYIFVWFAKSEGGRYRSTGPVKNIKTRLLPRIYLKRKAVLVKLSYVSIIGKHFKAHVCM